MLQTEDFRQKTLDRRLWILDFADGLYLLPPLIVRGGEPLAVEGIKKKRILRLFFIPTGSTSHLPLNHSRGG